MLIDWFTVLAQAVNFMILAWLLKRFLYQPVLTAIDRRDQQVALALSGAAGLAAAAQVKLSELDERSRSLDQRREALLQSAAAESARLRDRMIADEQEVFAQQRQDALLERRDSDARHGQAIAQQAEDQVFAITRKILRELSNSSLEAAMTDVFIGRLRALDATSQTALSLALGHAVGAIRVTSRFPLAQSQQQGISQALGEIVKAEVAPTYASAPASLGGIEISMPDYRMSWSFDGYLASLRHQVTSRARSLAAEGVAAPAAPPASQAPDQGATPSPAPEGSSP